jgi:hypothetical protein
MNIIQSYWSYPQLVNRISQSSPINAGWLDVRFNLMSWTLSCLSIQRYYPEIELYTENFGKELLIDYLDLPYKHVNCSLENLHERNYNTNLWALGKMYVYQNQNSPFLHIDGDVYIWQSFSDKFISAPLVCQSLEDGFPFYSSLINDSLKKLEYIPQELKKCLIASERISSINAGVIGGSDIEFFQYYTNEAFKMIHLNENHNNIFNLRNFNMLYEQVLCFYIANQKNKRISFLIDGITHEYPELLQFYRLPNRCKYIHVIGSAKKNNFICEQVEFRLAYEFPEKYRQVKEKIKYRYPNSNKISDSEERIEWLFDAYQFIEEQTNDTLLNTTFSVSQNICRKDKEVSKILDPHSRQWKNPEQVSQNTIYKLFDEPLSVNDIYDKMKEAGNESVRSRSEEEVKEQLLDLVLQNFIYDEYLIPI